MQVAVQSLHCADQVAFLKSVCCFVSFSQDSVLHCEPTPAETAGLSVQPAAAGDELASDLDDMLVSHHSAPSWMKLGPY